MHKRSKTSEQEEQTEVAAIILCSLGYANSLIRNNNKKRSNELTASPCTSLCPYISDSQRSEERKQQRAEEARLESNLQHKERDRKRKLTALPVKVSPAPLHTTIGCVAKISFSSFSRLTIALSFPSITAAVSRSPIILRSQLVAEFTRIVDYIPEN